ncbi:hypothetical protein [Flavobacterium sp.]|uniref:hypothetical protein n=1 Tax=Flavobacterium sp. TaxID=239 RepID=UPI00120D0332|nr:hypothetical protein [Flavobacterium sp.]RZJ71791.1 MAG: hypothetical protein EOO49_08995 [Flavobacterium sp.]
MSWDIVLFNSTQKIGSVEDIDEDLLFETDFDSALLENLHPIKIDGNNADVENENYALNFFLDDAPASNKMLTLYNENALYEIVRISRAMHWQIFDTGLGEMIDLEHPENNGFENFHAYLAALDK